MQNEIKSAKHNLQYPSGSVQDEGRKKNPTVDRQTLSFKIRNPSINCTIKPKIMEKNFGSRKGSVIAVDTDTFGLNRKDELLIIFSLLQNMQNSSVKHKLNHSLHVLDSR